MIDISTPEYLAEPAGRPAWLRVDRLLGEWGIGKDSAAGRLEFEKSMEWRRLADLDREFQALEQGWCVGSEEFRRELLEQVQERPGPSHFGEAVQEAVEVAAERLAAEAVRRLGWTEAELKRRRKGDPRKLELARELRRKTTMPLAWIAERLSMGTQGHLAWLLGRTGRTFKEPSHQGLLGI